MGLRTLHLPDGRTKSVEANSRFKYTTTIDIGKIEIIHRHYTLARAEKVAKRLAGYKTVIGFF